MVETIEFCPKRLNASYHVSRNNYESQKKPFLCIANMLDCSMHIIHIHDSFNHPMQASFNSKRLFFPRYVKILKAHVIVIQLLALLRYPLESEGLSKKCPDLIRQI